MPISVLIPTFNGQKLLAVNLPAVLKALNANDELIILDDASNDNTISWLSNYFNLEPGIIPQKLPANSVAQFLIGNKNKIKIKLLVNQQNLRFGQTVNRGFLIAENKLVWLLNNDVSPYQNAQQFLLKHFKDQNVFAVGCLEIEKNLGGIKGGKNKLWFDKGMFVHSRAEDFKTGPTAWASGGSAMFDREKWLKIGGFDKRFYPAYWEDIDLSYTAKKHQWQVLFEEKAVVNHNHESTNADVFGQTQLEKISWRNAQKFIFKHGTIWQKMANLLWRPYWIYQRQKKNKWQILAFIAILLLANILRFYKLGQIPHGMTWDEAAIGYNGFAILNTRRDEWLVRLPISFKSFGDFKAPLAIYLNGIFTHFLDMNLTAVRTPFALAGVASVVGIFLLAQAMAEFFKLKTTQRLKWPFWAMLGLSISPWHLHFSRVGFESGLALMFIVYGSYFLFKLLLEKQNNFLRTNLLAGLSLINFVASLYTYHSSKIFLPLFALLILAIFFKDIKKLGLKILPAILLSGASLYPLIKDSIWGEGMTRANSLIFNEKLNFFQLIGKIISQLLVHLSPAFLFLGQTDTLRHGPGKLAVLLPGSIILIILAFYFLCTKKFSSTKKKMFQFLLSWLIIGLIPAALATPVPHSNRALLVLPAIILILSLTLSYLRSKLIILLFVLIQGLSFMAYLQYYYQDFASLSADDFKDGYLEIMSIAQEYEKGLNGKPKVDKIIFTNDYGQAYIYALFVRQTNPIWYQGGSLIKYEFKDDVNIGDLSRNNSLIIGSNSDELPTEKADHLVYGSDNQVKFKAFYVK